MSPSDSSAEFPDGRKAVTEFVRLEDEIRRVGLRLTELNAERQAIYQEAQAYVRMHGEQMVERGEGEQPAVVRDVGFLTLDEYMDLERTEETE